MTKRIPPQISKEELLICLGRVDALAGLNEDFTVVRCDWLLDVLTELYVFKSCEEIIQNNKMIPDEKARLN